MRRKVCLIAVLFGLFWVAWSGAAPVQAQQPVVHVVESGETLYGIAEQYGVTVEDIAAFNHITDPSQIAVDQELIIPTGVEAGEALVYSAYVVVPGDTLEAVASRFKTTATAVAELNGVVNPVGLPAGQRLRVPGTYAGSLHQVNQGQTALGLALQYDLSLWQFLVDNDLRSPGALLPGQRVGAPTLVVTGGVTSTLPAPFVTLEVGPAPVVRGQTVRVKVELAPDAEVRGVFDDQVLKFAVQDDAHYALFGVHALDDPGHYALALLATDATGDEAYVRQAVQVLSGDYGYEEIILGEQGDTVLDPKAQAAERARLVEIRDVFNPERYWEGLFLRPIDTEITSFFGTRRLYQSASYQFYSYHEGTDFDGEVGTPVYAPADGVVVLAEPLHVRGDAIIIDHGWGVYSGYWHLSQIDVTVGQTVAPGDPIALVGSTGLSTGPHLHWDFFVNGTNVRALQWTEQVFP